jgi:hypothetical protein
MVTASSFWDYFWQYFPLVFFSSLGMLQIAAARADLKGLTFLKRPLPCYLFGAVAIVGAFIWFYATGDRNAEPLISIDEKGKLFFGETQTFATFMAGAFCALVATLLVSSVVNARITSSTDKGAHYGLDALKETTFFQAITRSLGKGVSNFSNLIRG